MTTTALHRAPSAHPTHRVARIFSKMAWTALTSLALIFVGLIVAQVSGALTLDKVLTGSMEPTIMTNDYVLSRHASGDDLKRGAILTYSSPAAYDGLSITHRVQSVDDGRAVMKGDNNNTADPYAIAQADVDGIVIGHVGGAGARAIEQFVPTPQWRMDLSSLIHDRDTAAIPALLLDAPWGLAAAFVLMLVVALVDRFVLRTTRDE